jgi:hypothetical protein
LISFLSAYQQHQQQSELNGSYLPTENPELFTLRNQMNELQLNQQELETRLQEKQDRVHKLVSKKYTIKSIFNKHIAGY